MRRTELRAGVPVDDGVVSGQDCECIFIPTSPGCALVRFGGQTADGAGSTSPKRKGVERGEARVVVVRSVELDRRSRSECDEAEYYLERSDSSLSFYSEDDAVGGSGPSTSRASLRKRRMIEVDADPDLEFDEEVEVVEVVATPTSKKGKTPIKGKYTDSTQAKAQLAAAMDCDIQREAAVAVANAPKPSARPTTRRPSTEDSKRADVLGSDIRECALRVLEAVRKSGHLKGTVVKEIKDAVATIRAASESLVDRTASSECAALRRENSRLANELVDMREMLTGMRQETAKYYLELKTLKNTMGASAKGMDELAMLKAERAEWEKEMAATRSSFQDLLKRSTEDRLALATAQRELADAKAALAKSSESVAMEMTPEAQAVSPSEAPTISESVEARIVRQIGDIFNARFEKIEELVGRQNISPPKRATAAPRTPGAAKQGGSSAPVAGTSGAGLSASQPLPTTKEQWTTVVRRGKRAKGAKGKESAPATQAPTGGARPAQKEATPKATNEAAKKRNARRRQFRPPRSSAIVLTLQPGAAEAGSSYSSVLREAQQNIRLDALGITELGFRLAVTGSRILEVPGPVEESGGKADALAAKLSEILPADVVAVTRPVKSAEFRVLDLDDATATADVVAAVVREGDCAEASVKTGEIRRSPSGSGSVWVRAPIGAVKRLVDAGKLRVGWTMARVRSLDPRPLRCYRCLLTGHVGQRCTAKENRGGACFRCGQDGHKAATCTAPSPHCPYCAAAKRKADHKIGSTKGCRPPKQAARVEAMEAESGPSPPTTGLAAADAGASAVT
ncbi:uncharacterized protein LOC131848403 [Achroia grisella]|uniref:uncharacterized protein LOC131848403 n=1 Tax=Achroia grisella TaxID=688607 RepID=UPI0027D29229|nr:uncharacterized protein LOC131848403 [Achroia grisella]